MSISSPAGDDPDQATAEEIRRLRAEHATMVAALQAAILDTTRLTRLFVILNEAAPLEKLLDHVLATLSELFMADIVVLLRPSGSGFLPVSAIGLPADSAQQFIPGEEGNWADAALRNGTPVVVDEARLSRGVDRYLIDLDAETVVWLPVKGDQPASRCLLVLARCRPIPFVRAEVDLLVTMAYRIGRHLDQVDGERERQRMQVALHQSEKAESLGRMAGAIAHHFNNMLSAVSGSLELATNDLPVGHRAHEDLARARDATKRAAEMSGLMLAYLGHENGDREPLELGLVLREAMAELQTSLPAGVSLTADRPASELVVSGNQAQIKRALHNLLVNAWEAMGTGSGEIRVSIGAIPAAELPQPQRAESGETLTAANYACLEVADTGCGMPPEIVAKIFDPFFTTKFVGRGLGLPVVVGTVRAHDGWTTVQSESGKGTTIRVYLPLMDERPRAEAQTPPADASESGARSGGLVLLADDEGIVRHVAQRVLTRMGYEVMTAADGVEAIDQFRLCQDDLRFVILDLTMPRIDGWEALNAIRASRPNMPVILASGYNETDVFRGRPSDRFLAFLHKPFSIGELRAAIAEVSSTGD